MVKVTILRESCKGMENCGICKFVCPKELYKDSEDMNETGYFPSEISNEGECNGCQNCMIYCPDFDIVVEKDSDMSPDQQEDNNAE